MNPYLKFLIVFIVGELIGLFVFWAVRRIWKIDSNGINWKAIIGGWIERIVLFFGLATGLSQVVIMFGALKIGTRVSTSKNEKVSSEYFLIGNLISALLAFLYLFVYVKWKYLV